MDVYKEMYLAALKHTLDFKIKINKEHWDAVCW